MENQPQQNGTGRQGQPSIDGTSRPLQSRVKAEEISDLLEPLTRQLLRFRTKADEELALHQAAQPLTQRGSILIPSASLESDKLRSKISKSLALPEAGLGQAGILRTVQDILDFSVNPSAPGFLDKLYAAPLPPGIAAELVLAFLNTNVHVYQVSPVLTLIEKHVTKSLAGLFGFNGPRAGGISVQGGSASNLTSIVAARNTLFPDTKLHGNVVKNNGRLTLFTSAHGHYSIEKAAQAMGFGSQNVVAVPVDTEGRMIPGELDSLIIASKDRGETPFYINATAGTTVLGSFDSFDEIAEIARNHHCWFHIDGSWGGGFVFADRDDIKKNLDGMQKADSIAINPHKMLGVPVTCSFLLTRDLRLFESAMTLKAGYLFHDVEDDEQENTGIDDETGTSKDVHKPDEDTLIPQRDLFDRRDHYDDGDSPWAEPNDLADLTLQCGRRGDSLKFFLCWQYYGSTGYRLKVESAYGLALYLADLVDQSGNLTQVLKEGSQPQCLQVCFHYTPGGEYPFGTTSSKGPLRTPRLEAGTRTGSDANCKALGKYNTIVTSRIAKALIARGFMIDFAPALDGQEDKGSFFRVVLNISTVQATVDRLVTELVDVGHIVVREMGCRYAVTDEGTAGDTKPSA